VGANQELGEVVAERPVAVGVAEVSAHLPARAVDTATMCGFLRQSSARLPGLAWF
jgi:hypothetical protein